MSKADQFMYEIDLFKIIDALRASKIYLYKVKEHMGNWKKDNIRKALFEAVDDKIIMGLKIFTNRDIFHSVRTALSAQENSPSPEEIAEILGKWETIRRIDLYIDFIYSKVSKETKQIKV